MDDLTGEFIAETRETLEAIGDALVAWEADPSDTARIDEIFRFVHTVKGSCGFLDLARIEALAHAAETVLGGLRDGSRTADRRLVGALLRVIDRIALLVDALETDAEFPPVETDHAIIAALDGAPESATEADSQPVQRARNVRVAVDLLDTMMSQVSDLVLVRNELARAIRSDRGDSPAEAALGRLSNSVTDLRESVARARMQPVERLFAALPRLVRDTAAMLGKPVELILEGSDVELDREMVEQLRDPLVHIVRNAIDHGVETPAQRSAAGKPATATLRVAARQSGNQISITVEDDGRGIDTARLRARAIDAGILDPSRAATLGESASLDLIFAPGLTTADTVTAISGRGVGMDVVRANVERLGGTIAIDNRPSRGVTIELRAPLTLSIVTVLSLGAGEQCFAVPRAVVEEVFALRNANVRLETLGEGRIATIRGETLAVVSLGDAIGDDGFAPSHLVVVATGSGARWALAVDRIGDHQEVVVRPVAPAVSAAGLFAGQALPDDGQPLLVLDMLGLARLARIDPVAPHHVASVEAASEAEVGLLLFTAIDGSARAIRSRAVERVADLPRDAFTTIGEATVVHDGGAIFGVALDAPLPDSPCVAAIRLANGSERIVMPVADVLDLRRVPESALIATRGGTAVVLDGRAVPVVDAAALFAEQPHAPLQPVHDRKRA